MYTYSNEESVCVAIEGCCHGQLDKIYDSLPKDTELLLICGDFQAIRNQQDLKSINVPPKYKEMGDFCDYYSGKKKARVMTIFIGGNHESSSYMRELQYGGWVAPLIYYLGDYGTVWYKGIRISGLSGIYNYHSFFASKSERPSLYTLPYGSLTIRSIYHVKPQNYLKLLLSESSDVVLSHDWPQGIWSWGDIKKLLKKKPFLKADVKNGRLGSPLAMNALKYLRPKHWFSSHMHALFEATVKHPGMLGKEVKRRKFDRECGERGNIDEISVDLDEFDVAKEDVLDIVTEDSVKPSSSDFSGNGTKTDLNEISLDMNDMGDVRGAKINEEVRELIETNKVNFGNKPLDKLQMASETFFLALDKCLPRRNFLASKCIKTNKRHPSFESNSLYHDSRAIAINKVVEKFVRSPNWISVHAKDMFDMDKMKYLLAELEQLVDFEQSQISADLKVPLNFKKVAPDITEPEVQLKYWPNNQTQEYCSTWDIPRPDLEGF